MKEWTISVKVMGWKWVLLAPLPMYIYIYICRHSILYPRFNQGVWLEWPSMYPKNHDCITCINLFLHYLHQFLLALHASIHSLHIIKMILRFKRSQQCFRFSNRIIGLKDIAWSSLHGQRASQLESTTHD